MSDWSCSDFLEGFTNKLHRSVFMWYMWVSDSDPDILCVLCFSANLLQRVEDVDISTFDT